MKIEPLTQPPLETSLMGVVRGVFDHYGVEASTPWLYGASGHAFVANVHEKLCPSGPYCWNGERFDGLLSNLGVARTCLGFFAAGSTAGERAKVEGAVREAVDRGVVCSFVNMDNQLIEGYDEVGFSLAQPWGDMPMTPGRLTFGTWAELGEEIHACFFAFEKTTRVDDRRAVGESLEFAADLHAHPGRYTEPPYGIGPDAYRNWIAAVKAGEGGTHGAWWNATVWAECRAMASAYLAEISERLPEAAEPARDLAARYAAIAEGLKRASDKTLDAGEKVRLLEETAAREAEAVARLPILREAFA